MNPISESEETITKYEGQEVGKDSHSYDDRDNYFEKSLCFYMSRPYDMFEFCHRFFEKICHKKES